MTFMREQICRTCSAIQAFRLSIRAFAVLDSYVMEIERMKPLPHRSSVCSEQSQVSVVLPLSSLPCRPAASVSLLARYPHHVISSSERRTVMTVQPPPPPPLPPAVTAEAGGPMEEARKRSGRGEVDFSAPFRSVKDAVERFGGSAASWRAQPCPSLLLSPQDVELMKLEEQTVKLEMDLFLKERETLHVLKELEMTKKVADGLRLHLQNEAAQIIKEPQKVFSGSMITPSCQVTREKCLIYFDNQREPKEQILDQKQTAGLILRELNQAKLYLNKSTSSLGGSQSSVELLKRAIENENSLLKKTRERFDSNIVEISALENEISKALKQLQLINDTVKRSYHQSPSRILGQMKELKSESEKFKRIAAAAKNEISRLSLDIQRTRSSIKTAEVRLAVARKVEAAARSAEVVALSEIKAQTTGKDAGNALLSTSKVVLPVDEYAMLLRRAQEADETLKGKMQSVMVELKQAQHSKHELLEKVEEANADVETCRKALHEALRKEEDANKSKVAAEETLRKWRSQHDRMWRPYLTNTKFKNSPIPCQRRSWILDVNGLSMVTTAGPSRMMGRPTLSIGQILSKKLSGHEEYEQRALQIVSGRPKVSLRQMLSRKDDLLSSEIINNDTAQKHFFTKRKRFSVVVLSLFLAKQKKKRQQKQTPCSMPSCRG